MIREEVEGQQFVIQGLVDCRPLNYDSILRGLRSKFPRAEIQLFRADHIAGKEHLVFAARGAIKAFRQHRERARSLAVELLLYTSCQRQISKAIQLLGVGPYTRKVALAAITTEDDLQDFVKSAASDLNGHEDDNTIEISSKKKMRELMKAYNVSNVELEAARLAGEDQASVIKRLIIERSALLAVEK